MLATDTNLCIYMSNEMIKLLWLDPVRLQFSGGFNRVEIGRIEKIINEQHSKLVEAWNEYFGD